MLNSVSSFRFIIQWWIQKIHHSARIRCTWTLVQLKTCQSGSAGKHDFASTPDMFLFWKFWNNFFQSHFAPSALIHFKGALRSYLTPTWRSTYPSKMNSYVLYILGCSAFHFKSNTVIGVFLQTRFISDDFRCVHLSWSPCFTSSQPISGNLFYMRPFINSWCFFPLHQIHRSAANSSHQGI